VRGLSAKTTFRKESVNAAYSRIMVNTSMVNSKIRAQQGPDSTKKTSFLAEIQLSKLQLIILGDLILIREAST
jgi:hypothetical protein